jgi:hypothetical protein
MHSNDDEWSYFTSQKIGIDHESIVNEQDNVINEDNDAEELQYILRRRLVLAGLPPDFGDIIASLDNDSNAPKIQSFDSPLQESLDILQKVIIHKSRRNNVCHCLLKHTYPSNNHKSNEQNHHQTMSTDDIVEVVRNCRGPNVMIQILSSKPC